MALDVASFAATTMQNYKKKMVDQIFADYIFLALMGNKELAPMFFEPRETPDGLGPGIELEESPGRQIVFPLNYKKNSTTAWYDGYDTLDITPQEPFTAAVYDWRRFAGSVNLSNSDLDKNSGDKWKIVDFMKVNMENLRASLGEDLSLKLIGTRGAGTKEAFGLLDLVKDDPTTNPAGGNVGGIDAVTNDWWRNKIADQAAAAFGTDQTGTGMTNVRKLIRRTTIGARGPQVLLGGDSTYESILRTTLLQQRWNDPSKNAIANLGFETINVGSIPLVREQQLETVRAAAGLSGDALYALRIENLKIYAMKRRWFEPSKAKEPVAQDTVVMHSISALNLCTNARRQQGVLFNIAAV